MNNVATKDDINALRTDFLNIGQGLGALLEAFANLSSIISAVHAAVSSEPSGPSQLSIDVGRLVLIAEGQKDALSRIAGALEGAAAESVAERWAAWLFSLTENFQGVVTHDGATIVPWPALLEFHPFPRDISDEEDPSDGSGGSDGGGQNGRDRDG